MGRKAKYGLDNVRINIYRNKKQVVQKKKKKKQETNVNPYNLCLSDGQ